MLMHFVCFISFYFLQEVAIPYEEKIYGKNYTYNITGLKYSHTPYDVRIYLKSFVAKSGPNDWSLPASVTFLTPPTGWYNLFTNFFSFFLIASYYYIDWFRFASWKENNTTEPSDLHLKVFLLAENPCSCLYLLSWEGRFLNFFSLHPWVQ